MDKDGYPWWIWIMPGGWVHMKPAKVYRAIKAYTPKNQEPLILKKGDFVRVEREDNEYEGFAWCGSYGRWVPRESCSRVDEVRACFDDVYYSRLYGITNVDEQGLGTQ
jgi:hypothetical protein